MNTKEFGNFIATVRKENGMTQAQLAEKLMVSPKTISRWETGTGYPDIELLQALADALHLSLTELMSSKKQIHAQSEAEEIVQNTIAIQKQNGKEKKQKIFWNLTFLGIIFFLHRLARMKAGWEYNSDNIGLGIFMVQILKPLFLLQIGRLIGMIFPQKIMKNHDVNLIVHLIMWITIISYVIEVISYTFGYYSFNFGLRHLYSDPLLIWICMIMGYFL